MRGRRSHSFMFHYPASFCRNRLMRSVMVCVACVFDDNSFSFPVFLRLERVRMNVYAAAGFWVARLRSGQDFNTPFTPLSDENGWKRNMWRNSVGLCVCLSGAGRCRFLSV
jgi:hypothetical protein